MTLPTLQPSRKRDRLAPPAPPQPKPGAPGWGNVPPIALYGATIVAAALLEALIAGAAGRALRAACIAALHAPLLVLMLRRLERVPAGGDLPVLLNGALSLMLAFVVDAVMPGPAIAGGTLVLLAMAAVAAPLAITAWREIWAHEFPQRATLLTVSSAEGQMALRRLEKIHGVSIANVIIPGCNAKLAQRRLGRPTRNHVDSDMRVQRQVIVAAALWTPAIDEACAQLIQRNHELSTESMMFEHVSGRVDMGYAESHDLIVASGRRHTYDWIARCASATIAALALLLLSPAFLIISVCILIEDHGPLFERTPLKGRFGDVFELLSFRTRRMNVRVVHSDLTDQPACEQPTRLARFLVATRLDKLPHLMNVVRGDLNLVGPRADAPTAHEEPGPNAHFGALRASVRPGLVDWGREDLRSVAAEDAHDRRLAHDLYYIANRSIWLDLSTLVGVGRRHAS